MPNGSFVRLVAATLTFMFIKIPQGFLVVTFQKKNSSIIKDGQTFSRHIFHLLTQFNVYLNVLIRERRKIDSSVRLTVCIMEIIVSQPFLLMMMIIITIINRNHAVSIPPPYEGTINNNLSDSLLSSHCPNPYDRYRPNPYSHKLEPRQLYRLTLWPIPMLFQDNPMKQYNRHSHHKQFPNSCRRPSSIVPVLDRLPLRSYRLGTNFSHRLLCIVLNLELENNSQVDP
jgi:hypothetical protein